MSVINLSSSVRFVRVYLVFRKTSADEASGSLTEIRALGAKSCEIEAAVGKSIRLQDEVGVKLECDLLFGIFLRFPVPKNKTTTKSGCYRAGMLMYC